MKKLLLVFIIALFALSLAKTENLTETYADFDDIEHLEIVKV